MPVEPDPRNDAGEGGGDGDLADEVADLKQTVERMAARQRAVIHALARMSGLVSSEMERLVAD